jgi:hypothetical protein
VRPEAAPEVTCGHVTITELETPPLRFVAGSDAVAAVEQKATDLLAQIAAHRQLSTTLAYEDDAI